MKRYDGSAKDDRKPIGGGSYNKDHKGSELYNFHNHEGWVYGFIQPAFQGRRKRRKLDLTRIDPGQNEAKLNDVLIIFVAKYKGRGPQVVVGWYRGATVFGTEIIRTLHGHKRRYFATTKAADAWLLREKVRKTFPVESPEVGLGRSDISYLYSEEGQPRALPGLPRLLEFTGSIGSGDLLALCKDCHSVPAKRKRKG
jgi:5-methylcytosine-specific restriction protein A